MDSVFIVRDTDERLLRAVYRHHLDALDWVGQYVKQFTDAEEGSEEYELYAEHFEILEMPLE